VKINNGMDSVLLFFFDRIYRIFWIIFLFQFPDETGKTQSACSGI
jgi:hypothetical protein